MNTKKKRLVIGVLALPGAATLLFTTNAVASNGRSQVSRVEKPEAPGVVHQPGGSRPPLDRGGLAPDEEEITIHRKGQTYTVKTRPTRHVETNAKGELIEVVTTNVDDVIAGLPADVQADIAAEKAKKPRD